LLFCLCVWALNVRRAVYLPLEIFSFEYINVKGASLVSTCTYIHTQKVFSLVLGIRLRFLLIVRMSAAASVFDLRFLFRVSITFMPTCDLSPLPFKYAAFARRRKRESHRHRKRVFEHSLQHRQTYERQIRPKKLTERSLLGEKERGNVIGLIKVAMQISWKLIVWECVLVCLRASVCV
jgi:hypothetical protein